MNPKKRRAILMALIVFVCAPVSAFDYESPFVPERVFTHQGHEDFADYIDRLEDGKVSFSLRHTGETASGRYGYGIDFGSYYDELLGFANQTVDANGSIHISEAIQWGKEILGGRKGRFFASGRTDPRNRKFTTEGKGEFEDYIRRLKKGSASFSIRSSGLKAAHKFDFGEHFPPFYDELHDLCKIEISRKGSVHISKVIQLAKTIVEKEFVKTKDLGIPTSESGAPTQDWFKEECEFLGHTAGTSSYESCIAELVEFYVD